MKVFVEPDDIYLHVLPVDFRKSINGLLAIVESELELSAFTGALFLFSNKQRDKLKVLHWDKTGFALWYKRLEKHKFKWPKENELSHMRLNEQQLHWLLSGFDIIGHQPLHYTASGL
ncbi:IS66 family insertion sequence element accessory protein TnpB [Alteromonas oceanisediminis]|uniref:IS66 family insertion sequence element accessory protein TnpB n=1 Tax=Alteromonas oceanisediminis TaxID=2836180 RepID=UPI001BD9A930|nr:IS66 family insertion sequence element accessory protein TnpB [Alteromonas oceanisediminis]MBT0587983.1 IS66 family insertion sequence element accessory protein TnpB [Alteromonas oceanisediminis]